MKQTIVYGFAALALLGCSAGADVPEADVASVDSESSALLNDPMYAIRENSGANPTQCVYENLSMHCCPSGWAMYGTLIPGNSFNCVKLADNSGARFLDKWTQRMGMHACPLGSVMVGLHEDANRLVCQWLPKKTVREDIDVGVPGTWHSCHLPGQDSGLMSGIRIDQAKYICAADANMATGGTGGNTGGGGVTTSTVTATITVDVGANAPLNGCGTTSFSLKSCANGSCSGGTPMTFMGAQLLSDSIYHCKYSAFASGVTLTDHRIDVSDFNSCKHFTPTGASSGVTLSPFTCTP